MVIQQRRLKPANYLQMKIKLNTWLSMSFHNFIVILIFNYRPINPFKVWYARLPLMKSSDESKGSNNLLFYPFLYLQMMRFQCCRQAACRDCCTPGCCCGSVVEQVCNPVGCVPRHVDRIP